MNDILIIYAHPQTKGNCFTILESLERELKSSNKKFYVLDLYKEGYNPVLEEKELYSSGNKFISEKNLEYQKLITESKSLVFIFPVWWGHMPAILKGFCDKVLTPGFAFKFEKLFGSVYLPKGLLGGKKCAVFMTSGSPKYAYILGLSMSPKKIINKMIFSFCGLKTKIYELCGVGPVNEESKKSADKLVKKALSWLLN